MQLLAADFKEQLGGACAGAGAGACACAVGARADGVAARGLDVGGLGA